jgi:PAS fold.
MAEERESLKQDVFDKTTELKETNERLRELVVLSSSVIYSLGSTGNRSTNFITENVEAVLGYNAEEFLKDPGFWNKHVHPDDLIRVSNELKIAIELGEGAFEYRFKHLDDSYSLDS